ncbi:MAG TPA: hypothetical protein VNZ53_05195 [Steroidobacteraceae bacterium]|jgi:hypothetical protein|nr:hypothetical protein [Steroidobacteraceae bacterium]
MLVHKPSSRFGYFRGLNIRIEKVLQVKGFIFSVGRVELAGYEIAPKGSGYELRLFLPFGAKQPRSFVQGEPFTAHEERCLPSRFPIQVPAIRRSWLPVPG